MKKKILASCMVCALTLSMTVTAFGAAGEDKSFDKVYKATNGDTVNPEETFSFSFTPESITNAEESMTIADMPVLPDVTTTFAEGTATVTGAKQSVNVALGAVEWPSVGVYTYKLMETVGNTAGVTYNERPLYMVVTVAFDEGTNKFYTAAIHYDDIKGEKTGEIVNEYSAGSLDVTKEVTGNMGDKNKEFDVTVTFTAVEGKAMNSTITYVEDGETKTILPSAWTGGTATAEVALKHGETITFKNLPYGVTYTVVEDDYTSEAAGGYDEAEYDESDAEKKIDSAGDSVKITNHKQVGIDTGINMDNVPYIVLLCAAAAGLVMFTFKNRFFKNN